MVVKTDPLASKSINRRRGRQSYNHVRNSSIRITLWEARCILRKKAIAIVREKSRQTGRKSSIISMVQYARCIKSAS